LQPDRPLLPTARDDDPEVAPANVLYAAEAKDAAHPEGLERIAEDSRLAILVRIRGGEDDSRLRPQQALGNTFAAVTLEKAVRNLGTDDAIDPTLENRRRLPPPVGMDDDDPLRRGQLGAVSDDLGIDRAIAQDLLGRK